jgi:succinyl-diaminopimelate desuccinylase
MATSDPIALARDLIRCPSVTPADGGALAYIESVLKPAGFTVHRVTFEEGGTDPIENLYARIGTAAPHLMFAGHTDVVPPGDQTRWSHPPFASEIEKGVLYGRGAVDMKGAIACKIAATLDYLDHLGGHGGTPQGSISFLITGDEEGIAVNGTVKLLQWAAQRGEKFDHCILGEPTNPQTLGDMIKIGRRGSQNGTLIVTGTQGHVAYPELADNPVRGIVALIAAINAEPLDAGTAHFGASNLEFTSVDVGNKTVNLIPADARARFNIRFNDTRTRAQLRAEVERRAAKAAGNQIRWSIEWESSNSDVFVTTPGPFVAMISSAITEVTGIVPTLSTTGGTSDARFIKDYCPVIEFGLLSREMHKIDEHVATKDLVALTAIYRHILQRYFG